MKTNQTFEIEKGIPYPNNRGRKPLNPYPFNKMKKGDSFLILLNGHNPHSVRVGIYVQAKSFTNRTEKNWIFSTSEEKKGIRVWRTK